MGKTSISTLLQDHFPSLDFPPDNYLELISSHRQLNDRTVSKNLVVLTNITINPLVEVMETFLWKNNIDARVIIGNYDNIVQDSVDQNPEHSIIIFWELWNIFPNIFSKIEFMSELEYQELFEKLTKDIHFTLTNLKRSPLILFNRFSLEPFPRIDGNRGRYENFTIEVNKYLEILETKFSNLKLIDIDQIHAFNGRNNTVDTRFLYSTSSIYTYEFYKHYSALVSLALTKHNGDTKKVLVLDCDNTLWGGVIGEDGVNSIEMSLDTPNGAIFCAVQNIFKEIGQNGALICLCTKNNQSDLDQVFNERSDMILNHSDIIRTYANWNPKVENIRNMARDLNVGLESFVFIDDSDFEIGLVKSELPEVTCIQVPKKLSEYVFLAKNIRSLFGTGSLTKEDMRRTEMYKADIERGELKNSSKSIDEYLKSLSMCMTVRVNDKITVQRVAQMTQKTNQFNLTTIRLSQAETLDYVESTKKLLVCFELSDIYGNNGITGASFLSFKTKTKVNIDNILLSCRVLGRDAEYAFIESIVGLLSEMEVASITCQFIPTSKNEQVSLYYENLGFDKVGEENGITNYKYEITSINKFRNTHIQIMREN